MWTEADLAAQRDLVNRKELAVFNWREACDRAPYNLVYRTHLRDAQESLRSARRALEQMAVEVGRPIQRPMF